MESCNRVKDGNGRLVQVEDEARKIWKEYFEDLVNIDTRQKIAVHMCGFAGIRRGIYFGRESIGRAEVEERVVILKNGKAAGKDEIRREMIKGRGKRVVGWIWRLCNMAFASGVVPEDWRSALTIPLYKGKGERTECKS